ncbi:hypothetical protein DCAR_0729090 [Daucus carota subsp. sativus]|uniref:Uncharacterized protein n=1 Tax=Daucus carota subsp. sativus TaxID=79200 RepID=A0A164U0I9_DAUCS|nr:hypothetical protein DCAR_0729090 [Daucus carota subsp. sativus]
MPSLVEEKQLRRASSIHVNVFFGEATTQFPTARGGEAYRNIAVGLSETYGIDYSVS